MSRSRLVMVVGTISPIISFAIGHNSINHKSITMIIPSGVSHREFWYLAKSKGIKLSSRYVGVYLNINSSGSPSWMARVQGKNKWKFKRFEFSEKGELEASKFYNRYI